MNDKVKIMLIAAIAMVVVVSIYVYFSPYHSCVRAVLEKNNDPATAAVICAKSLGGEKR